MNGQVKPHPWFGVWVHWHLRLLSGHEHMIVVLGLWGEIDCHPGYWTFLIDRTSFLKYKKSQRFEWICSYFTCQLFKIVVSKLGIQETRPLTTDVTAVLFVYCLYYELVKRINLGCNFCIIGTRGELAYVNFSILNLPQNHHQINLNLAVMLLSLT